MPKKDMSYRHTRSLRNRQPTEFELKAEAYHALKQAFRHVRGDVKLPRRRGQMDSIRPDITVLDDYGRPIIVIRIVRSTRCKERSPYPSAPIPCLVLYGVDDAANAATLVHMRLASD